MNAQPTKTKEAFARIVAIAPQTRPVGSRVTCNPRPQGTDADYLVYLLDPQKAAFWDAIREDEWEQGGSMIRDDVNHTPVEDRFYSFRHGDVNLIVTYSQSFSHRFLAATSISRRFNLLDKPDRIALFQAVLYGRIDAKLPFFTAAMEMEIAF
jgi:hypothetical protein